VEPSILNENDARPLVLMVAKDGSRPCTWHPRTRTFEDMFNVVGIARIGPLLPHTGRGGIVAYT
jgi:hypothetical protein